MSSGQRRRVPGEFPRMKYRGRAKARHERMAQEAALERVVEAWPALAEIAAGAMSFFGEVASSVGAFFTQLGESLRPKPDPSPAEPVGHRGYAMGPVIVDEIQHLQLKSPAEIDAIEHNRARYHELEKLRRGQPNTYNETEYR